MRDDGREAGKENVRQGLYADWRWVQAVST